MKIPVIPIGNSKGIRIPKAILEQCSITDDVSLEVKDDSIIIKPVRDKPRKGWGEHFKKMKDEKDDRLVVNDQIDLEMEDWEW